MKAPAASARRWKGARRSRAAERDASESLQPPRSAYARRGRRWGWGPSAMRKGGAPRALKNAGWVRAAFQRAFMIAAAVLIFGGSSVLACTFCFGAEETSMIDGTKLGVLVLLAITFAVQGGFLTFFLYLRKRAKRIADIELDTEWSELQKWPRTS